MAQELSLYKRNVEKIIMNKYLDDQHLATAMSISNDIDEVSTCIVCPHCRLKSQKDWIVKHLESKKRPRIRISLVYFRCVACNEITKINDPKLIKFIDYEVMKNDQF
ncbi:hypothetical protein [Candidatus Nitrosocosmicus sp. SS]|jgi:hypothetical protein|uniref:hypothetical protein n=1 Tax=Candidatus Nitrosocosmicus agrestis TaxID=2563600 RepID=UPI00122DD9F3|nr:hypothetical protein [Candidatus Nitrosocosmicus sp. SS]KAA2280320.1 hypothetical protein F1Z66_11025 [Candidatus Nitrosocosmicus sp. SS]KAF0867753.1 hypothetical protein E5N71_13750 [Candidatus Nitrosocosmicus sp. SS]MDR4491573.1 hypothetical protein [Candidatus Nitrosocosmicus sp.]